MTRFILSTLGPLLFWACLLLEGVSSSPAPNGVKQTGPPPVKCRTFADNYDNNSKIMAYGISRKLQDLEGGAYVDKSFDGTPLWQVSTSPLRLKSTLHGKDVPEKNIVAFFFIDKRGKESRLMFTLKGGDVCQDPLDQGLNDFFKTHTITKVVHYQLSHW